MALSSTRPVARMGDDSILELLAVPVAAAAVIYQGGMVVIDAGYAKPATSAAGKLVAGISVGARNAGGTVDNTSGANGALTVQVRRGTFKMLNDGTIAQANVGQLCYAKDDQTVALADLVAGQSSRSIAGKIIQVDTDGVWVEIFGLQSQNDIPPKLILTIPLELASITAAQVVAAFTPGFAGRILKALAINDKPATTGGKAATLQVRISGTNVTGGVLALTSANQTPQGNVVAGTGITAANVFTAADTLDVQASGITAFVEGRTNLLLVLG